MIDEAAGARLMLLPPCSPDIDPIENALAKLKALPRKADERSVETLCPPSAASPTPSPRLNAPATSAHPDTIDKGRPPLEAARPAPRMHQSEAREPDSEQRASRRDWNRIGGGVEDRHRDGDDVDALP
jgi:hypothetical protein